jgi:serine O-acetyltransferase
MKEPPGGVIELWQRIREDWIAHNRDWTTPGFRAVAVYRFGVWQQSVRPWILRAPLWLLYRSMYRYIRNHYGIELYVTTIVGRRLVIGHQGGIVIHQYAEIGDDCQIHQNVTIGAAGRDWRLCPKLGHRVEVGCGAAIIGKVTIGDDVRIGPNAVVMTNVPAGAIVVANPPRMIKTRRSENKAEGG